eukprot:156090-Prorocentrum_lima.AAC.1
MVLRDQPIAHGALKTMLSKKSVSTQRVSQDGKSSLDLEQRDLENGVSLLTAWLFDKSERVRKSSLRLLVLCRKINGMKLHKLVPLDMLELRLSVDAQRGCGTSVERLIEALLGTFFPQGDNVDGALQ